MAIGITADKMARAEANIRAKGNAIRSAFGVGYNKPTEQTQQPAGSGYQTVTPPSSTPPKPKASNAKTIGIAAGGVIVVIIAIIFFLKA